MRLHRFLTLVLLAAAFLRLYLLRSIPPGLHYDLATNLLIGSEIAFGGYRPIFITAFTGREVLFFYWLAPLVWALGARILTLHLAGAFLGLLTVPATYFAVRHVFAYDRHACWLAALSAALLAGNLWHVLLSRLGYRLISEPLVQALALGYLFCGLRRLTPYPRPLPPLLFVPNRRGGRGAEGGVRGEAWLLIALGGAFTGLAADTYLAARAFPIPLAAAFAVLLVARPRATLGPLVVFGLAALAVFAPLGYFFYTHPGTLFTRIGQVAPAPGDAALLRQSALAGLKMIFVSGDPYLRFNVPFRPIFGPLLGAFWLLGLALGLVRLARARGPLERAAETMLLVWTPAMLLPTILAVHEIFPSNVRAIGLIPLVFVPAARGLIEATGWMAGKTSAASLSKVASALVSLAALALLTASTGVAYFAGWGRRADVYRANDGDLAAAATWLNAQDLGETPVYVSAIHYRHPTLAVLAHDYDLIRWFTGGQALATPASGPAVYLFPHSAPPPAEWLAGWETARIAAPPGPDGEPDFVAYRFDEGAAAAPESRSYTAADANFDNIVELLGYRRVSAVSGRAVVVDLFWRVLNPPATGDFRIVADLVDDWGFHWAQGFNDAYPSEQWEPGETVIARVTIPAPTGLPPGDYPLQVTFFAPSTGERLTTIDSAGKFAGAIAPAGPIAVEPAADATNSPAVHPAIESRWRVGPLALLGYDPPLPQARPGDPLSFALYWQAATAPRETYLFATKLVPSGDGQAFALERGGPAHDTYPTDRWSGGEIVVDRHSPRLPRSLPPGAYNVQIAMTDSSGRTYRVYVGRIEVPTLARDFAPPVPGHAVDLSLGNVVALAGYDFRAQAAGQTLTLYWHALAETDLDYTVYVHVLDASGRKVAQRDVMPRDNSYPTSLWLTGEYVADEHPFSLPPGSYSLEVGMYVPETGETLGGGTIGKVEVP